MVGEPSYLVGEPSYLVGEPNYFIGEPSYFVGEPNYFIGKPYVLKKIIITPLQFQKIKLNECAKEMKFVSLQNK